MYQSMSPTQGTSAHHAFAISPTSPTSARGFKRSASSDEDNENGDDTRPSSARRNTAVKRACNECRQQKLKCNVQQDPFVSCARCQKQNLRCVIEPNFKRVGKRNRNAEMEKEMEYLRERLAMYEGSQGAGKPKLNAPQPPMDGSTFAAEPIPKVEDEAFLQTQHQQVAATSLLDLRSGSPMFYPLGTGENHVRLSHSEVNELFTEYFQLYHPFLPFLDQVRSPDEYLSQDHKLLFWAIISVAARRYGGRPGLLQDLAKPLTDLIWDSIRNQPNHHVVKALCLLCTWPIPAERTVTDPTFILCGAMMQVAMQIGLHQPTHAQDFARTKVRLRQEDINDRMRTWAVCNTVAQTVSTGNGQPSITLYNSTLEFEVDDENDMRILPPTLFVRLRQEKAADRIGRMLYSTHRDRTDEEAVIYLNMQAERFKSERKSVDGVDNEVEDLYHRAVSVHLHLHSFFLADPRLERREDLVALYFAATGFLDCVFKLHRENRLLFVPYYILQMSLAAGFALLKLLNSDFAGRLPVEQGRKYVLQTVEVLRKAKVWPNDLLDRFAEVLAQLWKESSRGRSLHSMSQSPSLSNTGMSAFNHHFQQQQQQQQQQPQQQSPNHQRRSSTTIHDDPLGLIVRSRKSMSVVFDCVWRWREAQVSGGADQLDSTVMTNPTNPDSSSNSTPPPGTIVENPAHTLPNFNPHLNTLSMPLALPQGLASANSFEFFDSVSWMLDSQNDWNNYPTGGFGTDFGA